MALFKKKKKDEAEPQEVDEFGIMDGDDDDVFSSAISPSIGYDDDDFEYEDDFDDEEDDESGRHNPDSSQEGVDKKKFFGFLFLIIIVLALAAFFVFGSSQGGDSPQPEETSQSQEDKGANKGIVVQEANGETYNGNDDGNPVNGTGAILAFDYAYYTERSGEKAREYFNPDAKEYDADYIQKAIDTNVPEGTKYDLAITPKSIGKEYDVVLTITEPGTEPYKFNQKFSVMEKEGRFYVENFTSTPSKENSSS